MQWFLLRHFVHGHDKLRLVCSNEMLDGEVLQSPSGSFPGSSGTCGKPKKEKKMAKDEDDDDFDEFDEFDEFDDFDDFDSYV